MNYPYLQRYETAPTSQTNQCATHRPYVIKKTRNITIGYWVLV